VSAIALPLMVASIGLLSGFCALVLVRCVLRQLRQRAEARGRAAVDGALHAGDPVLLDAVAERAARDIGARDRLADVLVRGLEHHVVLALRRAPGFVRLMAAAAADTESRDAIRRTIGADVLAALGDEGDVARVGALVCGDPDVEVRQSLARALARRGDDAAAWRLIEALRVRALPEERLIEQLGRPFAVAALLVAVRTPALAGIRSALVEALGLARPASAGFAIAAILRDGSERERAASCSALGRIRARAAVSPLLDALVDDVPAVRALAARALAEIGDPRAIEPLTQTLEDPSWWVRANAAEALRRCDHAGHAAPARAGASETPATPAAA
jgi:HEAT repeat protein